MSDKPISVGSMILTLIEPHPGHAVAYNRWYEDDHLYATLLGPGAIAGARFVARRPEKARRQVADGIDPSPGSLLAVYWLIGDGREHAEWRVGNVTRLAAEGRFYRQRDLVYGYTGRRALSLSRQGHEVPVELALDHRYPHLAMSVIEVTAGRPAGELCRWYREKFGPLVTAPGSPVALTAGFVARRTTDPRKTAGFVARRTTDPRKTAGFVARRTTDPKKTAGPPDRPADADDLVVLWFCDVDPSAGWDDLVSAQARVVTGSGAGRVTWTSPFVATVVGTDTYMDQL